MPLIKGSDGYSVNVDSQNRAQTYSIVQDLEQTLLLTGLLSSVYFAETPSGADDYFLYIKNIGTANIGFNKFMFSSTVATKILVESVSGTPSFVTGTTPSITNLNLASPLAPAIEITHDTDITGLVSEGVLTFAEAGAADTEYQSGVSGGIVIPQGKAIAFKRIASTGTITMNIPLGILAF